jgi:hypothetical protein
VLPIRRRSIIRGLGVGAVGCALAAALAALAAGGELAGPSDWHVSGTAPSDYRVRLDPAGGRDGSACAVLAARQRQVSGFVTLMQQVPAAPYRGRRLRVSAWIKAAAVEGWTGLWVRADGPGPKVLSFDSMQRRPVRGSSDWTRHAVAAEVPETAETVLFGIILQGPGEVRVDDFSIDAETPEAP